MLVQIGEGDWVLRGNALNALNDLALSCEGFSDSLPSYTHIITIVYGKNITLCIHMMRCPTDDLMMLFLYGG